MRVTIEVTAGPAKGKLFAFDHADLFIVGRARDSKISLPNDPYLSRQHFVMEIVPPNCKVTDLDSKNGTFVNGVRYGGRKPDPKIKQAPDGQKSVTIQNGEIVVGDTRLKIKQEGLGVKTPLNPEVPKTPFQPAPTPLEKKLPAAPVVGQSPAAALAQAAAQAKAAESPSAEKKSDEPKTDIVNVQDSPAASGEPGDATRVEKTLLETPIVGYETDEEKTVLEGRPMPQLVVPMPGDKVLCARCDKDCSREVGSRGRIPGAEYICHDCRANNAFALKARVNRSRRAFEFAPERETPHVRPLPASPGVDAGKFDHIKFPGYKVIDVLGSGGMGVVYKSVRLKDNVVVAIKALLPNVPVTFENYRIFHREIELTGKLRHPNIVEVLDHGHVKGSYFCVLEFIDGLSLKDYVHQMGGKLTLKQAAPLMLDALAGLSAAHHAQIETRASGPKMMSGIVHRDLKPENILLKRDAFGWTPKIADFGIAKSFESAGMTDMTIAGVCGTPTYWPREQLTHYRYLHPATDVFSIACVFYEVLSGRCARPGMQETLMQSQRRNVSPQLADFMRVICSNPIPPLRSVVPEIPPAIAAVIDRALLEVEVPIDETEMRETLQRLRYPDAGVFREALADALRSAQIVV